MKNFSVSIALLGVLAIALFCSSTSADPLWIRTTARLNLRSCGSTQGCRVLRTLAANSELEVVGRDDKWLNVRAADGSRGWVHSSYTITITRGPVADNRSGIVKIIYAFAPILLVGGVLFGLGYSGRVLRRGMVITRALKARKAALEKQGLPPDQIWYDYKKKASTCLLFPSLGWGVLYFILFMALSPKDFVVSLLGLVVPILGYHGLYIVPSIGADDIGEVGGAGT